MAKRSLEQGLSTPASKPVVQPIVQGQGYRLSTTNPDAELEDIKPQVAEATKIPVAKEPVIQRENAKLDPAIIKAYKKLAVDRDKKLYEVMEEALVKYLKEQVAE